MGGGVGRHAPSADGTARVGDSLALGRVADEAFALVGKGDHAGGQAVALLIDDDLDLTAFHHGHDRVRRAQVDATIYSTPDRFPSFPRTMSLPAAELAGMMDATEGTL